MLALVGTLATIALAYSVSAFVASVFAHREVPSWVFPTFVVAGVYRAFQAWFQEFMATRASTRVKAQLRQQVIAANWRKPPANAAELGVLAGRGLDALDPYFAKYLPQLVYTALATPLFVALFWFTDLESGVTLLITIPLVPLFMVLIGWATSELQAKQFSSLNRLAGYFSEVLKALGTLKLFGREKAQEQTIGEVSDQLRLRTLKVLRVSFLSGFALELISSLSVALIAVSIGMRLVGGDIDLRVALFLLILAPEAFLPLRQVGANFHASSEGMAAAAGVLDYLDTDASVQGAAQDSLIFGQGLTLIKGASGSGKSALFEELLGFRAEQNRFAWLAPTVEERRELVAWMPQRAMLGAGSVAENVVGFDNPDFELLNRVMDVAHCGHLARNQASELSGGEAARVALARALYRLESKHLDLLLLDEPTAAVDLATAREIRTNLALLAKRLRVVVISHEAEYETIADEVVHVA